MTNDNKVKAVHLDPNELPPGQMYWTGDPDDPVYSDELSSIPAEVGSTIVGIKYPWKVLSCTPGIFGGQQVYRIKACRADKPSRWNDLG